MPSHNNSATNSSGDEARRHKHQQEQSHVQIDASSSLPDHLARKAELVASGELPFAVDDVPADLLPAYVGHVRRLRRRRLVQFIARAIANDIHRSRGKDE